MKQHFNIVFLGHVDAGKSSLCGTILLDTGMVDERTASQAEQEAENSAGKGWSKAFLLDTDEEERRRGKTVEVGREVFGYKNRRWTILDAPGHRNYVPNAIEGIVCADICVLVVSARKGEFEAGISKEGQTREHLVLTKAFGVPRLVVFVNKMDSIDWDQTRYEEIVQKIKNLVNEQQIPEKFVSFVPGSGYLSENISKNFEKTWWKGSCFLDILDDVSLERRQGSPRFSVMSTQRIQGKTTLFGKVERGTLSLNQQFWSFPGENPVQILEISTDFEKNLESVTTGNNAILTVSSEHDWRQGDFICSEDSKILPVTKMLCFVHILETFPIFCAGTECVMQLFLGKQSCVVEKVLGVKEKERFLKCRFLKKGSTGKVLLAMSEPVLAEPFEVFPKLGRFVLRDKNKTLAVGKIVSVKH